MSEGPLNGTYSLQLNCGDVRNFDIPENPDGVTVSRTFENQLNKIVTVNFFDRHQSRGTSEFIAGTKYTRSFVRVDQGDEDTQVGIGSYQDYDTANASEDFFYINDGGEMIRTDVECTFGWHQFKFDYSTPGKVVLSIDDVQVAELERDSFDYISMSGLPGHNDNYIDQVYVYGGEYAPPVEPLPDVYKIPGTLEAENYLETGWNIMSGLNLMVFMM